MLIRLRSRGLELLKRCVLGVGRRNRRRVEVGFSGHGFGDLVGELVEVFEVLISIATSSVFSRG